MRRVADHRDRALHAARERHRVDLVGAPRGTERRRPDPRVRRRFAADADRCRGRRTRAPRLRGEPPLAADDDAARHLCDGRRQGSDRGQRPRSRRGPRGAKRAVHGRRQAGLRPGLLRGVVGRGARRGREGRHQSSSASSPTALSIRSSTSRGSRARRSSTSRSNGASAARTRTSPGRRRRACSPSHEATGRFAAARPTWRSAELPTRRSSGGTWRPGTPSACSRPGTSSAPPRAPRTTATATGR